MLIQYVILQAPNDGYYWLVKATSDKHFNLIDTGFIEVYSGNHFDCCQVLNELQDFDDKDSIWLRCEETMSLIVTTNECLQLMLCFSPNYLDNKEFVE